MFKYQKYEICPAELYKSASLQRMKHVLGKLNSQNFLYKMNTHNKKYSKNNNTLHHLMLTNTNEN